MARPYDTTTGEDLLRNLSRRVDRLERGSGRMRAPELEAPLSETIEGAAFFVFEGQLYARVGDITFLVSLTPL